MKKDTRVASLAAASLAVAGVTSLALAGVASAAPAGTDSVQVASTNVTFSTELANTPQGAKQLFFRIRLAAEEVCRTASYPVGHEIWTQHACETAAVANAVRSAGIPALSERYLGRATRDLVAAR